MYNLLNIPYDQSNQIPAEQLFAKLESAFRTKEDHLRKIIRRPERLAASLAASQDNPDRQHRKP